MPVTPFMFLDLPTVSVTPGTDWAEAINVALGSEGTGVSGHDHSSGKGVPVPSRGLNINAALDFQQWSAINLESTKYVTQTTEPDGTYLTYFLADDFYVVDGNGNSVRITENGAISAASFGGITGLVAPASASFATDTFTWLYDTGKYAVMASGPLLLRRDGETNPNYVKITPPATLAASYTLTLPAALPASTAYATVSSAGVVAFPTTAIAASVDTAAIQDLAVSTAKIAALAVSRAKLEALGGHRRVDIHRLGTNTVARINDQQVNTTAAGAGAVTNFTQTLQAGNSFVGLISQLMLFDAAVSATDSADLYNAIRETYGETQ